MAEATNSLSVERHHVFKQIARAIYKVPGSKTSVRVLTRAALTTLPLSLKNRQRLYNFSAEDTIPNRTLTCRIHPPFGKPVKAELDLQDGLSRTLYYWGYAGYEPATVRVFLNLLRTKNCVFDVGANVGYYTLLAASVLEGSGEVHAFEPCPRVFHLLSKNVKLNNWQCLRLNRMALAEADGEQRLFIPSSGSGTNASLIENFTKQDSFEMVQTIRFDSYCHKNIKGRVDLIKLDVEGAEMSVLRGAGTLFDEWSPDVICEVLKPFEGELDRFFTSKAYRKFLITDDGLQEKDHLDAHNRYRDYYLSRTPTHGLTN